jgi:hypothetical protein
VKLRTAVTALAALGILTLPATALAASHPAPRFMTGKSYDFRHNGSADFIDGTLTTDQNVPAYLDDLFTACSLPSDPVCSYWTDLFNTTHGGYGYSTWLVYGSPGGGQCLKANSNALKVVQVTCNGTAYTQQWRTVEAPDGKGVYLSDYNDGEFIDDPGGGKGTNLILDVIGHATEFTWAQVSP